MLKKVIFCSLLLQGVLAMGQSGISVHLPGSGDFLVFASHGLPTESPASPVASKGGTVSITPGSTDDTVTVFEKTSGNLGSRPISKLKGAWEVSSADLDHLAQARVHVDHNGLPVAAGEVTLEDGTKRQPELLDSKSGGDATFFDVKPGRIIVSVKFKAEKGGVQDVTQVFKSDLTRDKVIPDFTVAIAANVDTVGSAAPPVKGSTTAGSPEKSESSPSIFGTLIAYLLAFLVAGGVIYGVVFYFKKEPGTVQEKLEKLGVQIPKPDDQDAYGGSPAPISIQKPEPPQKIVLDDSAPVPLTTPLYSHMSPITPTNLSQEPTLLTADGVPISLMEGETLVGRDPGLGLSLTGESSISRRHASVERQGLTVTVNDLGSTNGTFVNGARLQSPVILRPGDSVQFGSVAFRYQS